MSQQRPAGTNWEQVARDRLEEIERLRAFVGDELIRSDWQSAGDMRKEVERLRAEIHEARTDRLYWAKYNTVSSHSLEAEVERLRALQADKWRMEGERHQMPCIYGSLCPYCEVERLRADIKFAKEVRDEHIDLARVCNEEVEKLRSAIKTVLADEESREGGWGPDVTMVYVLRAALEKKP